MDPITLLSLFGTIGSGVAGVAGANSANNNAMLNYYNAEADRAQAQSAIRQQQYAADRIRRDAQLGTTNARGDRSHFVPGQGWVVDLSPTSQALQTSSDEEELRRLFLDQGLRRNQLNEQVADQGRQGEIADSLLNQFNNITPQSESGRRNELFAAAAQGMTTQDDAVLDAVLRQTIRSGSSNAGDILASFADNRSRAMGDAYMGAAGRARSDVANEYASNRGRTAELYDLFQSRSSQPLGTSYQPSNAGASADAMTTPAAQRGLYGDSAMLNSVGRINPLSGGSLSTTPNDALATALGGGSWALGGLLQGDKSSNAYDELFGLFAPAPYSGQQSSRMQPRLGAR